jgi:hypothetical protein
VFWAESVQKLQTRTSSMKSEEICFFTKRNLAEKVDKKRTQGEPKSLHRLGRKTLRDRRFSGIATNCIACRTNFTRLQTGGGMPVSGRFAC